MEAVLKFIWMYGRKDIDFGQLRGVQEEILIEEIEQSYGEEIARRWNSQPDLLEACEGLMEKADDGSADFDDPVPGSIYLKASAAIVKAKQA